ncbi:MAG: hypothetical protein AAF384_00070 [Pseudomonadota bacterium]
MISLRANRLLMGIPIALALAVVSSASSAATVTLRQSWQQSGVPLSTATTFTQWDDSSLTGVGTEFVIALDTFSMAHFIDGIGQSSNRPLLPFELPIDNGDLAAVYQDGVFSWLATLGTGNARFSIVNASVGSPSGALRFALGPISPEMIWSLPVSGVWNFNLVSSSLESTAVPLPAAGWLCLGGLGLLVGKGRRRRG